ncbi:MAG TPA: flagellar hook-basal body complex protein FliE [Candidatus Aquilonibacter sp.]|nr:flagellar hook-basal body complex protein FliE [Candidatus Aquilonibacter sp.]
MDITNYGNAINNVAPGTFAPDIAPGLPKSQPLAPDEAGQGASSSFKDTLTQMLGNVNDQMVTAQQKSMDLALGKSHDQAGTIKAVEEASLGMQFTLAMRNKILDAYNEVMRMNF